MKRGQITQLRYLKEGDHFEFIDTQGKRKGTCDYYVEGQYPKFRCTTVYASCHIWHSFSGPSTVEGKDITPVENTQLVKLLDEATWHINHVIAFNDEDNDY